MFYCLIKNKILMLDNGFIFLYIPTYVTNLISPQNRKNTIGKFIYGVT